MVKLYGITLSVPVLRVKLCLNALGVEYEAIPISPGAETQTTEYLAIHPAGKVPAIDDDGFTLFESNAIMKYLCRKHDSSLYPTDLQTQAKVDQWVDFSTVHVGNGFGRVFSNTLLVTLFGAEKDERSLQVGRDFISRFMPIVDQQLGLSTYLAGDELTIADLCLLGTLDPAEVLEVDLSLYSNINQWREQLRKRAFYQDIHVSYDAAINAMKDMLG